MELEARGVPTVVLVTQVFDKLSLAVAKGVGLEQIHRHVLPHPLNPLPEQKVRAVAREHLPSIVEQLLAR